MSIRATGRLLSVDKDTVNHWLPVLGAHCQNVMGYFFRHLHLLECQLDELWTFIAKIQAWDDLLENLRGDLTFIKQLGFAKGVSRFHGKLLLWLIRFTKPQK